MTVKVARHDVMRKTNSYLIPHSPTASSALWGSNLATLDPSTGSSGEFPAKVCLGAWAGCLGAPLSADR